MSFWVVGLVTALYGTSASEPQVVTAFPIIGWYGILEFNVPLDTV